MAVVNSFQLLRRVENQLGVHYYHQTYLCDFKLRLAKSLMMSGKDNMKKRDRPSAESAQCKFTKKKKTGKATKPLPEEDIRKDGIGHLPTYHENRGTCKNPDCKGKIHMFCMKCKVHLCCEKNRNCFVAFHQN